MSLELAGEDELQGVVKGDEALIKGGVVEAGEAESIADIEATTFHISM